MMDIIKTVHKHASFDSSLITLITLCYLVPLTDNLPVQVEWLNPTKKVL